MYSFSQPSSSLLLSTVHRFSCEQSAITFSPVHLLFPISARAHSMTEHEGSKCEALLSQPYMSFPRGLGLCLQASLPPAALRHGYNGIGLRVGTWNQSLLILPWDPDDWISLRWKGQRGTYIYLLANSQSGGKREVKACFFIKSRAGIVESVPRNGSMKSMNGTGFSRFLDFQWSPAPGEFPESMRASWGIGRISFPTLELWYKPLSGFIPRHPRLHRTSFVRQCY
jgi:hypothetical protein